MRETDTPTECHSLAWLSRENLIIVVGFFALPGPTNQGAKQTLVSTSSNDRLLASLGNTLLIFVAIRHAVGYAMASWRARSVTVIRSDWDSKNTAENHVVNGNGEFAKTVPL